MDDQSIRSLSAQHIGQLAGQIGTALGAPVGRDGTEVQGVRRSPKVPVGDGAEQELERSVGRRQIERRHRSLQIGEDGASGRLRLGGVAGLLRAGPAGQQQQGRDKRGGDRTGGRRGWGEGGRQCGQERGSCLLNAAHRGPFRVKRLPRAAPNGHNPESATDGTEARVTPTDNTDAPAGMAETRPDDAFWRTVVDDIRAGRFWNAEAKSQDGQPVERLEAAMAGLPRGRRLQGGRDRDPRHHPQSDEGRTGTATGISACSTGWPPVDAHPTDEDERAALTGERLYSVSVDYDRLGHASLGLLNKTDRVWLTERWGEPAAPTTADAARGGGTARVATPAPAAPSPSTTSPAEKVSAAADSRGRRGARDGRGDRRNGVGHQGKGERGDRRGRRNGLHRQGQGG